MKKNIFEFYGCLVLCFASQFLILEAVAQSPAKVSYQAVVRDSTGTLVIHTPISVRMSIFQGSISGSVIYREVYTPNPATNAQGLVSLEIGTGVPLLGSFASIDWSSGPFFLQTEVDINGGSAFRVLGSQQLLSVPYALYSERSGGLKYSAGTARMATTNNGLLYLCDGLIQSTPCLPTITTRMVTAIGSSGAMSGGYVASDGGSRVTARGVVYDTLQNPSISSNLTGSGSDTGGFISPITGLLPSKTYYVRAFATNYVGTSYGNEISFTTSPVTPVFVCGASTLTDIDGNTYTTVEIGGQCWMRSNLKVSKYRNGDPIPTGFLSNTDWRNTLTGAFAIYGNLSINDSLYGKLYKQFTTLDSRGLCPTGWHVPTDGEWNSLVKFLDSSADTACTACNQSVIAGGALRSLATQPTAGGWSVTTGATNSSGFTALPGGIRHYFGDYDGALYEGYWWTSTSIFGTARYRMLFANNGGIYRGSTNPSSGASIRCLKD